jgi:molecular chaperone DnaK (HSP70)
VHAENSTAIGLDFGTSTTLIASPTGVVPISDSSTSMPSLVGHGDDGSVVVGEDALHAPVEQVVRSIKRSITERRDFVQTGTPAGVRDVRVDDLIVEVLREAARRGMDAGQDLTGRGAVRLGCPAMWDGRQRRRLLEVAQRAGLPLTLASLVDEPVAAGISWLAGSAGLAGRQTHAAGPLRVLVFDMGGGTLDIAVLDVRGGDHRDITVLAALGVAEAGDALDDAIAEDLDYALGVAGIDVDALARPDLAREPLLDAAREVKIALTTTPEHVLVLPPELFGANEIWYTRDQLNAVFAPQMDRAEQYVTAALRVARLTKLVSGTAYDLARTPIDTLVEGVDVVVLSGGMSQIPYVAQRMEEFFEPTTRVELASAPPEDAVALGLAKAAHYGRINMHRPAFDVLVEWDRGRECRTIYEAYTPLVEQWQIVQGDSDLRFIRDGADLSLPSEGMGRLRVVSHSGEPVPASIAGNALDGFPVALDEKKFEFSIYPNGRIVMTDGGGTYDGHVGEQ